MEDLKEKQLKQKRESFDETKVIDTLSDIIKKNDKQSNVSKTETTVKEDSTELKNKTNPTDVNSVKTEEIKERKKEIVKNQLLEKQSNQNVVKEAEKIVNNAEKQQDYEELKQHPNVEKKKKTRVFLKALLILIILTLLLVIFSTVFSIININNTKIMRGIKVNGVDISNLSKQEAVNLLNNTINNTDANKITIYRNGITDELQLEDIDGKFDVESAVDEAYKIGREGNIVKCNYDILLTQVLKKSLNANFNYEEELLEKKLEKTSLKMPDVALNSSYVIDGDKLIVKNSTDGYKIKKDEFEKKMKEAFSSDSKSFEIPVEKVQKEEIDIEKIYKEIYKQPVNAYYTTNPQKIYKEEEGLDFSITVDEAKKLFQEDKEEYIIPLKKLEPSIKVKDLDKGAFPDLLASFTTYYGTGDSGRCYNIYLAAKSITETVVMPGETFSYNNLIGECSTRTGYRESTIYLNGELAKGIGGGICQVSTTLYNAVLRANLEVVQRRNHSLSVTYVPLGQDAMVSIGSSDFQFKNNRDYPIKVVASTGTGNVTCQIYGLKNSTEYEVKLETRVISKTATKTKTETYKILYLNGKEVSRTLISTDTYKIH